VTEPHPPSTVVVKDSLPRWVRAALTVAVVLITVAVFLFAISIAVWIAPSSRSNAESAAANAASVARLTEAVKTLTATSAIEKQQDACYDRFGAVITEGNANTLVAIVDLFVELAGQQRNHQSNPAAIDRLIEGANRAGAAYTASVAARNKYVADHRPLPCPLLPSN
jgi:hypothetical protein